MMNTSNLQRFAFDPQTATVKDAGTWITTGSTMRAQPEISPDGNRLVYHTVPAREDVFVSAMDGSGVQQYTNDRARNRVTRWSPDGKEIAFYSNRSGVYEIWAMNADGTNHRQLTGLGGSLAHPAWSPNGQQMAASNLDKAGVMIFDPHKKWSEQTPVTLPEHSGRLANLDWSPNGRKLLARTTAGVPSLVIYDFDSRTYTTLVRGVANNRWLDDGRILYSAAGRLMLLTLASNETRQVLPGNDVGAFSISRDGRQLVVARGTSEADIWMATIK
jgi:dipeptidyl aminopeptidase/acylaminoacyl peptidase